RLARLRVRGLHDGGHGGARHGGRGRPGARRPHQGRRRRARVRRPGGVSCRAGCGGRQLRRRRHRGIGVRAPAPRRRSVLRTCRGHVSRRLLARRRCRLCAYLRSARVIATLAASIPSPSQGVWHLGPVPLRAYALAIIAGIIAAAWLTSKRWAARGGDPEEVITITYWAV